ncbi:MAG: rRNA (uracil1498-N3)-methyltransferase [Chthoniobacter sp.]|jgi:16S rRNA (uracil1498-N3)-methyltransferase|nr:rRNA (uracil1498-N3)-methyltransferase [Chthoniobacter sp.]
MHRFYIPPEKWNLDQLALGAEETHHALDVLRMKAGERAVVFNGRGAEATVEIAVGEKKSLSLRRLHDTKSVLLECAITLGQAVPKGKNMDLIVQKAVELGAAAIAPLLSDRTVIQCDADDAGRKQVKWQTIAIEAAKQCGQNWLPEIAAPRTLKKFFEAGHSFDLMLIASLQSDARHLKTLLADFAGKPPRRVLILVGPEGDFTPAEIALAKSHGCRPITLGPIILRTETAALYCLSVLSYELLSVV